MHGPAGTVYCCIKGRDRNQLAATGLGTRKHPKAGSELTRLRGTRNKERHEMTDTQVTWLTQESHDRLKTELDQLIANRPVIAAEINDRREEGDLRENGG